ncbi:hypothetical protein QWY82_16075 [Simiduia curdlanivorans]|uniref:Alpha/beta fold hydrolase n=1 Tax=Simiduia curdlanivorans TaxID=1492769 RepID=A0ABV8V0Z8_9GAMM|nr:alpha/beta fold hydrolase [Simiduia curdlanivorans]MDN3640315.1 hypothetical protein [Simiduia curdlanivorans]
MNSILRRSLPLFGLISTLLASIACTTTSPYDPEKLARQHQWQREIIATEQLNFMAFSAPEKPSKAREKNLFIYLEGDGQAWASRHSASSNPTPVNAIGLGLAIQHQGGKAVYLSRPCQFLAPSQLKNCDIKRWTSGRYSEQVIAATHLALLQLKQKHNADKLILVGYSGGGTLAAFVAAREKSVSQLITVAAPVDHKAWTNLHQVSSLSDSLSIHDYNAALAQVPQIHFSGGRDNIVPKQLIEQWVTQLKRNFPQAPITTVTLEDFDHHCCWVEKWPEISKQYLHGL